MTEKWINAFIDVGVEHIDFVDYQFKKHNIHEYIISHETKPRDHFHLVGFTTRKNWDNTMKTFLDKFDLRTKRAKGVVGGKVKYGTDNKPVSWIDNLKSYVLKQTKGDFSTVRSSNIDSDALMKYYEKSYEKEEKKKIVQELHEHLEETFDFNFTYNNGNTPPQYHDQRRMDQIQTNIFNLKLDIINYLRINTDINMCRSNLSSYTQYHLKHTAKLEPHLKNLFIYYNCH